MQNGLRTYKIITSTQYDRTQHTDPTLMNTVSGLLVILLPVVAVCAIVGYRKHRAKILQQHIQRLNRILELDSSEKLA